MPCDYYVELMLLHRPTPALLQHSGRSRLHHPLWLQRGYSVATAYLSRPYDRGLFHLLSVVAHQPQRLIVALDCHVNNPKMRLCPSPEAGCLAPKLEAVGSSSPSRDAPAPRTRPCLPTPAHPPSREVGRMPPASRMLLSRGENSARSVTSSSRPLSGTSSSPFSRRLRRSGSSHLLPCSNFS